MQGVTADYLCPPGFRGPQGLAIAREASLVLEAARLAGRSVGIRKGPRQCSFATREQLPVGDPIVLVPGFMAGDYTLRAMSAYLRRMGCRTYGSQIRSNARCLAETADHLEQRAESIAIKRDRPVVLIGHSLGGLLSRGLASRRPDLISGVVTMGSPLLAPTAVHQLLLRNVQLLLRLQQAGLARVMGPDCTSGECARQMWEESQLPLRRGLPFTSIYSQRDGIMDWKACLDPAAKHVEVRTSHCGMAIDPRVFDVVTDALADIRARELRRQVRVAGAVAQ